MSYKRRDLVFPIQESCTLQEIKYNEFRKSSYLNKFIIDFNGLGVTFRDGRAVKCEHVVRKEAPMATMATRITNMAFPAIVLSAQ